MKSIWKIPRWFYKWMKYFSWVIMAISVVTLFTDKTVTLLILAVSVWAPLAAYGVIAMTVETHEMGKRVQATQKLIAEGRPLSELPPEYQEEIQVSWARHKLGEADR